MAITREQIPGLKALLAKHAPDLPTMSPEDRDAWNRANKLVQDWTSTDESGTDHVYFNPKSESHAAADVEARTVEGPPTQFGDPRKSVGIGAAGEQTRDLAEGVGNTGAGLSNLVGLPDIRSGAAIKKWAGIPDKRKGLWETMGDDLINGPAGTMVKSGVGLANQVGGTINHYITHLTEPGDWKYGTSAATGGLVSPDQLEAQAQPIRRVMHNEQPSREEMHASNVASGEEAPLVAMMTPETRPGESVRAKLAERAIASDKKFWSNKGGPKAVQTRMSALIGKKEMKTRIARGETPGLDVLTSETGKWPTEDQAAETLKTREKGIEDASTGSGMQFKVPEENIINAVAKDTMEKEALKPHTHTHPIVRDIVQNTEKRGYLSAEDYETLRQIDSGEKTADPVGDEETGKPIPLPRTLKDLVSYVEDARHRHGGELSLTPEEIRLEKVRVNKGIKDEEFLKTATEADKTASSYAVGRSKGLRKVLEESTLDPDHGKSAITEADRKYAQASSIHKAAKNWEANQITDPPINNAVMTAGGYGLGSVVHGGAGAILGPLFGLDPLTGATLGAGTSIPFGSFYARRMRDLILSPRLGTTYAKAKSFFHGSPPVEPTLRGPGVPPKPISETLGGTVQPPPTQGGQPSPQGPAPSGTVPSVAPQGPAPAGAAPVTPQPTPQPVPPPTPHTKGAGPAARILAAAHETDMPTLKPLWIQHGRDLTTSGKITKAQAGWIEQKIARYNEQQSRKANPSVEDVELTQDAAAIKKAKAAARDAKKAAAEKEKARKKAETQKPAAPPTTNGQPTPVAVEEPAPKPTVNNYEPKYANLNRSQLESQIAKWQKDRTSGLQPPEWYDKRIANGQKELSKRTNEPEPAASAEPTPAETPAATATPDTKLHNKGVVAEGVLINGKTISEMQEAEAAREAKKAGKAGKAERQPSEKTLDTTAKNFGKLIKDSGDNSDLPAARQAWKDAKELFDKHKDHWRDTGRMTNEQYDAMTKYLTPKEKTVSAPPTTKGEPSTPVVKEDPNAKRRALGLPDFGAPFGSEEFETAREKHTAKKLGLSEPPATPSTPTPKFTPGSNVRVSPHGIAKLKQRVLDTPDYPAKQSDLGALDRAEANYAKGKHDEVMKDYNYVADSVDKHTAPAREVSAPPTAGNVSSLTEHAELKEAKNVHAQVEDILPTKSVEDIKWLKKALQKKLETGKSGPETRKQISKTITLVQQELEKRGAETPEPPPEPSGTPPNNVIGGGKNWGSAEMETAGKKPLGEGMGSKFPKAQEPEAPTDNVTKLKPKDMQDVLNILREEPKPAEPLHGKSPVDNPRNEPKVLHQSSDTSFQEYAAHSGFVKGGRAKVGGKIVRIERIWSKDGKVRVTTKDGGFAIEDLKPAL